MYSTHFYFRRIIQMAATQNIKPALDQSSNIYSHWIFMVWITKIKNFSISRILLFLFLSLSFHLWLYPFLDIAHKMPDLHVINFYGCKFFRCLPTHRFMITARLHKFAFDFGGLWCTRSDRAWVYQANTFQCSTKRADFQ